ncbi:MAG: SPOR domain-containing protein [Pyrinomonadaceae bacterium]
MSESFRTHVTCARCATPFGVAWLNGEGVRIDEDVQRGASDGNRLSNRPASLRERIAGDGDVTGALRAGPPPSPADRPTPTPPPPPPAPTDIPAVSANTQPTTPAPQPVLQPPPVSQSKVFTEPAADKYAKGARLMRVSPLTLLFCGVTLIGFVVFCNWLLRPDGSEGEIAAINQSRPRAPQNQAANLNSREAAAIQNSVPQPTSGTSRVGAFDPAESSNRASLSGDGQQTPAPASSAATFHQSQPEADAVAQTGFTVQLGSFNLPQEAEVLVQQLATAGFEARIDPKPAPRGKTWYRVHSGLFPTHEAAAAHGSQLRSQKLTTDFIVAETEKE